MEGGGASIDTYTYRTHTLCVVEERGLWGDCELCMQRSVVKTEYGGPVEGDAEMR